MIKKQALLAAFTLVFMLSGFSGLIYESIWSHYLKLLLGHASYAQVLVLAIFMGGMAIGSMVAAKLSKRLTNLILCYGVVELLVGILGILFHSVFTATQSFTFNHLIPSLGSPEFVHIVKWSIAAVLILPQSIMLGATFPLLTVGILRKFPEQPGNTIAKLYFANSFGAAIGILFNSFVILPAVGLPGSVMTAGIINIILSVIVYRMVKGDNFPQQPVKLESVNSINKYLLVIAGLTGVASFLYEIAWIRMLTMVLGGSTHSFEIMLAAFILGLAIGGFWIRKKIDRFKNPIIALALIQITMGVLAILTIPLYGKTFDFMSFVVSAIDRTDEGHFLYLLFSLLISLLVMLPATICAGTTLPLISYLLIQNKSGDSSIGRVYAWNTIGAIVGVALASQIIMPILGLKSVIVIGGGIDLLLGAFLLWVYRDKLENKRVVVGLVSSSAVIVLVFSSVVFDTKRMASGVFRYGMNLQTDNSEVVFHEDGKTSTVAVKRVGNTYVLVNNGKPDAGILLTQPGEDARYSADEPTMALLGALPYVYKPDAKLIANIGMGSGMTAHTALLNPDVTRVDTVEIEEEVFHAAKLFESKVGKIFNDSRSKVIIEDAKTYFAASQSSYDVIISEPPNPWVSGVAGLFTEEFYKDIQKYLSDDGVLVQWMHVYELNPELLATVYKALENSFEDIHIYQVATSDFAFVASNKTLVSDFNTLFEIDALSDELKKIDVMSSEDIEFRKLAGKSVLAALFESFPVPANSDYFPVLDYGASKARFKQETATGITQLRSAKLLREVSDEKFSEIERVMETVLIEDSEKYNLIQEFDRRLEENLLRGFSIESLDDNRSRHSGWAATYLKTCARDISTFKESSSEKIIEVVGWLFGFYPDAKMLKLLDDLESCNINRLSNLAQSWVKIHKLWLKQDYLSVKEVSDSILEKESLDSSFSRRVLSFNLAAQIKLGEKKQFSRSVSPQGYKNMMKDMELRSLIFLSEKGI
ncbi:spermidine synthase [Pseudoteredinibacter isoporae]|uniref:Polyamine aminopropyltransferase n=1 Tax=Pseudoteredinibacter isoporae TaxID=570281 RepID=A0A7X0JUV4_9GAMM|nr:spermidine synthase [Pseudoteredinibacter isoporae]MBB6522702.1 putative membrane-bound spermidine synthase [Pseudoteredinibacter isoporae]NHO88232.1 spermidine synthase [Pseudoteredinibacter isoporae]NIB23437.1 spermidine synthase [Pseudoteredinibacter isoporae]